MLLLEPRTSETPIETKYGVELYLSDPNEHRFVTSDLKNENPILLRPARHTRVLLEPWTKKFLPEPYSKCVDTASGADIKRQSTDTDLYEQTLDLIGFYSQKYCFNVSAAAVNSSCRHQIDPF